MARKRKTRPSHAAQADTAADDAFPDSADEFYTGKDQILLHDGPAAKRRASVSSADARMRFVPTRMMRGFDRMVIALRTATVKER